MGYARRLIVPDGGDCVVHAISRCVRQAWLCGRDAGSGKDYGHRLGWVRERVKQLAGMRKVRESIADGRVLGLLEGFLKRGVMEGTDWTEAKEEGTLQDGVISPLLANVYLDPLDWLMAGMGFEMVRYADDMFVMCRSREEANAALEKLREWTAEAGLTLHPEKSRVEIMRVVVNFHALCISFGQGWKKCLLTLTPGEKERGQRMEVDLQLPVKRLRMRIRSIIR